MTIKTEIAIPFRPCGPASKNQDLFQVAAGVDLADALNEAACLLDMVSGPIFNAGMGEEPLKDSQAWLVLHALESAKAVIESLAISAASVKQEAES